MATAKPKPKDVEKAKQIFQEAEDLAAEKEYQRSATKYLDAYALFPATDFLFNAAEMYKFAGASEQAVEYYRRYLSEAPDGRGAKEAQSSLSLLEKELEDKRKQDKILENVSLDLVASDPDDTKTEKPEVATVTKTSSSSDSGGTTRAIGIASLSVGAVLVGVGVYYGLESSRISDEVSASSDFMPDLEADGKAAQRNAFIFSGVGAAALVGGAILYLVVGKKESGESSISLLPSVQNNSVSAVAVGTF